MITPIEIRQHQFKKSFQGFNKDEVNNFLNNLSMEWERMVEDMKRVKSDLERTQTSLDGLRKVESALHKTLLQAEETSKATVENAKRDAEQKIQDAENKSADLIHTAMGDRDRIEKQIHELVARRGEILKQLQSYLTAQSDRLKTFEDKEMQSFSPPARPQVSLPTAVPQKKPVPVASPQVEKPVNLPREANAEHPKEVKVKVEPVKLEAKSVEKPKPETKAGITMVSRPVSQPVEIKVKAPTSPGSNQAPPKEKSGSFFDNAVADSGDDGMMDDILDEL